MRPQAWPKRAEVARLVANSLITIEDVIMNEELWEKVIENIRYDIKHGDCEALYELLSFLPDDRLEKYLPEDES